MPNDDNVNTSLDDQNITSGPLPFGQDDVAAPVEPEKEDEVPKEPEDVKYDLPEAEDVKEFEETVSQDFKPEDNQVLTPVKPKGNKMKMVVGALVLLFIVAGGAMGLGLSGWLSDANLAKLDFRQRAAFTEPGTGVAGKTCGAISGGGSCMASCPRNYVVYSGASDCGSGQCCKLVVTPTPSQVCTPNNKRCNINLDGPGVAGMVKCNAEGTGEVRMNETCGAIPNPTSVIPTGTITGTPIPVLLGEGRACNATKVNGGCASGLTCTFINADNCSQFQGGCAKYTTVMSYCVKPPTPTPFPTFGADSQDHLLPCASTDDGTSPSCRGKYMGVTCNTSPLSYCTYDGIWNSVARCKCTAVDTTATEYNFDHCIAEYSDQSCGNGAARYSSCSSSTVASGKCVPLGMRRGTGDKYGYSCACRPVSATTPTPTGAKNTCSENGGLGACYDGKGGATCTNYGRISQYGDCGTGRICCSKSATPPNCANKGGVCLTSCNTTLGWSPVPDTFCGTGNTVCCQQTCEGIGGVCRTNSCQTGESKYPTGNDAESVRLCGNHMSGGSATVCCKKTTAGTGGTGGAGQNFDRPAVTPSAGATASCSAWCTTWNCPNGDTNGDKQCTYADTGASFTSQSGTGCGTPSSGCGQVDFYKAVNPGTWTTAQWDSNFCGVGFIGFTNCSGGGGQPSATATATVTGTVTAGARGVCSNVVIQTKNSSGVWVNTAANDVANKAKIGDTVRFVVSGATGTFSKARFRVNSGAWTESTSLVSSTNKNVYYLDYVIKGGGEHKVEAQVYGI